MPRCVVKQPNGMYAIFSTVVDDFTHFNMTESDVREFYLEEAREKALEQAQDAIDEADDVETLYPTIPDYKKWRAYEECLEIIRFRHGNDRKFKVGQETS